MEVRDAGCNSNTESGQRLGCMVQETETGAFCPSFDTFSPLL